MPCKPFQEVNLKSAIMAMVDRLNEGVKRLELASEISASGLGGNGDEMRMELANVAQVGMEKWWKMDGTMLTRIGDLMGYYSDLMGFYSDWMGY